MNDIQKIKEFFSKSTNEAITSAYEGKDFSIKNYKVGDIISFKDGEDWKVMKVKDNVDKLVIKPHNEKAKKGNVSLEIDIDADYLKKNLKEDQSEEYMISKSGSKFNPYYVLEKPDGSKQIDMMFTSPEEAKKYAAKKNLKISSKPGYNMNEAKSEDPVDTITMDIPLFLRMLEYSREDASQDMDLHDVTEKANKLGKERGILSMEDYEEIVGGAEEIKEGIGNEVGDKVYFKGDLGEKYPSSQGYYGIIEDTTPARNYNMMATYDVVVYDKNDNEIRTITTDFTNLTTKKVNEASDYMKRRKSQDDYAVNKKDKPKKPYNPTPSGKTDYMKRREAEKGLEEKINEALNKINEELCPAGKAYIKRRKAAGEKSSAYLSGRAVKVCKGQMSGKSKKK